MRTDNTIHFVIHHTSTMEYDIRDYIEAIPGTEVVYYRQCKTGHIPTVREFKIYAKDKKVLRRIKNWILENYLDYINEARKLLRQDEWVIE